MITLIAAVAEDGSIGKDNNLLWRLPNDLKRFKALTTGNVVVMGRKTFESLPNGALPHRRNVVLTRSKVSCVETETIASIDALVQLGRTENLFVIGGGEVYLQAIDCADRLCLTLVHHSFPDADTHFVSVDLSQWSETWREEHPADERHLYPYTFVNYARRTNRDASTIEAPVIDHRL